MSTPEQVFREMIEAFGAGDRDAMRVLLADDLVAFVTNAEGGADRVEGADAYLARVPEGLDATYSATVTQVVTVDDAQVLGMVEIKAERKGKTLHNHAGFLARVDGGRISGLWMVDALPEYSDEFWA